MRKPLGYWDYTVVLTYIGMLCSFLAILFSINEWYFNAILFLMIAGICDMFDGAVAGTKARTPDEKKFGIQIDSLSDLVSFGIMPAVFVYMISGRVLFYGLIAALFALAALVRLAFYNVSEEARQQQTTEKRKVFQGLPVTSIALLLPAVFLLAYDERLFHGTLVYFLLLLFTGIGFLSPFELKKPAARGKLCLILIGVAEFVAVVITGWGIV